MKIHNFFILLISTVFMLSCKTQKREINYMKDIEQIALENSIKNSRSTIQPNDQMIIFVTARDMDVVAPFNQSYNGTVTNSATLQQRPLAESPVAQTQTGPTYIVDSDGNIMMNILGEISTTGLTIEELRDKLRGMLTRYIKDPVVNIKTINYKITVLGEVARPNTYIIPDGNITILSALGLAGDLTAYGIRQNVLVVRNVDGQIMKERIDLTSANFMNSPVFYLKQNDVVYVEANETKEKTGRLDPNTGTYIAIGSIAVSLIIGVIALFKN